MQIYHPEEFTKDTLDIIYRDFRNQWLMHADTIGFLNRYYQQFFD